jgi:hypothetical protein
LKDSQSRLTISKSDAGNYLHPLLNEGENLAHGIEVNTYGQAVWDDVQDLCRQDACPLWKMESIL